MCSKFIQQFGEGDKAMKKGTIRKMFVPLMIALISTGCGTQDAGEASQQSSIVKENDDSTEDVSATESTEEETTDTSATTESAKDSEEEKTTEERGDIVSDNNTKTETTPDNESDIVDISQYAGIYKDTYGVDKNINRDGYIEIHEDGSITGERYITPDGGNDYSLTKGVNGMIMINYSNEYDNPVKIVIHPNGCYDAKRNLEYDGACVRYYKWGELMIDNLTIVSNDIPTKDWNFDDMSLEEFKTLDFQALFEKADDLMDTRYDGEWSKTESDSEDSGVIKLTRDNDFELSFEGTFLHENTQSDPPAPFTGQYSGKMVFATQKMAIGKIDEKYTDGEDKYVGFFWDVDSMQKKQKDSLHSCMGNDVTSEGVYTRGE